MLAFVCDSADDPQTAEKPSQDRPKLIRAEVLEGTVYQAAGDTHQYDIEEFEQALRDFSAAMPDGVAHTTVLCLNLSVPDLCAVFAVLRGWPVHVLYSNTTAVARDMAALAAAFPADGVLDTLVLDAVDSSAVSTLADLIATRARLRAVYVGHYFALDRVNVLLEACLDAPALEQFWVAESLLAAANHYYNDTACAPLRMLHARGVCLGMPRGIPASSATPASSASSASSTTPAPATLPVPATPDGPFQSHLARELNVSMAARANAEQWLASGDREDAAVLKAARMLVRIHAPWPVFSNPRSVLRLYTEYLVACPQQWQTFVGSMRVLAEIIGGDAQFHAARAFAAMATGLFADMAAGGSPETLWQLFGRPRTGAELVETEVSGRAAAFADEFRECATAGFTFPPAACRVAPATSVVCRCCNGETVAGAGQLAACSQTLAHVLDEHADPASEKSTIVLELAAVSTSELRQVLHADETYRFSRTSTLERFSRADCWRRKPHGIPPASAVAAVVPPPASSVLLTSFRKIRTAAYLRAPAAFLMLTYELMRDCAL